METPVATVVKNAGSHYLLSPLPQWAVLPAVLRGKNHLFFILMYEKIIVMSLSCCLGIF